MGSGQSLSQDGSGNNDLAQKLRGAYVAQAAVNAFSSPRSSGRMKASREAFSVDVTSKHARDLEEEMYLTIDSPQQDDDPGPNNGTSLFESQFEIDDGQAEPWVSSKKGFSPSNSTTPIGSRFNEEHSFRQSMNLNSASKSGLHVRENLSQELEPEPLSVGGLTDIPSLASPGGALEEDVSAMIPSFLEGLAPSSSSTQSTSTSGAIPAKAKAAPLAPSETVIRWQKGGVLGMGAFGQVCMGLCLDTGELIAVKQVTLSSADWNSPQMKSLQQEVELMRGLSHPNIVQYLGTSVGTESNFNDTLNIFMEFVPGGSIQSLLKKFGVFEDTICRVYTKQILEGLQYLHSNNIVHRDIKGGNILIDHCGTVKLADFGASKKLSSITSGNAHSIKGSPFWMAPEVIRNEGHSFPADIWSLGCTVIEMLTGSPPFSEFDNHVAVMFHIASTDARPVVPETTSVGGREFLQVCFARQAALRPTAAELLDHDWILGKSPSPIHSGARIFRSTAGSAALKSPQVQNLPRSPKKEERSPHLEPVEFMHSTASDRSSEIGSDNRSDQRSNQDADIEDFPSVDNNSPTIGSPDDDDEDLAGWNSAAKYETLLQSPKASNRSPKVSGGRLARARNNSASAQSYEIQKYLSTRVTVQSQLIPDEMARMMEKMSMNEYVTDDNDGTFNNNNPVGQAQTARESNTTVHPFTHTSASAAASSSYTRGQILRAKMEEIQRKEENLRQKLQIQRDQEEGYLAEAAVGPGTTSILSSSPSGTSRMSGVKTDRQISSSKSGRGAKSPHSPAVRNAW